jgi:hypothetical protein
MQFLDFSKSIPLNLQYFASIKDSEQVHHLATAGIFRPAGNAITDNYSLCLK